MKKTKFAIIPVIIVGILVALSRCDFDKITKKKADPICDNVNISAEACKNLKKMLKDQSNLQKELDKLLESEDFKKKLKEMEKND